MQNAPKKQQTSSTNLNNQPDLSNDAYLLQLDDQKLTKEVQGLKQIIQSPMLTINKLLNEQNPQKQQHQQIYSQEMERQIIQIEWKLRQKFNLKINQLEQIQFNQQSNPDQEECRIRPFPIRKQKKMLILQKTWTQGKPMLYIQGKIILQKKRGIQDLLHTKQMTLLKKIIQPYLEVSKKITHTLRQFER